MSYCVNCGVELAPSEKGCPLCGVEVLNPAAPWAEPRKRPYPSSLERVLAGVDRRYGVSLASMLMLIPILVTMLINILVESKITWSLYVVGGLVCLFVIVLMPLAYTKSRPFLAIGLDYIAVSGYIFMICLLTKSDWFLLFALPLTTAVCLAAAGAAFLFTKTRLAPLSKYAYLIVIIGLLTLAIEAVIGMYLSLKWPGWSLLVLLPCIIIAGIMLYIESHKKLKDQIKRRLYY